MKNFSLAALLCATIAGQALAADMAVIVNKDNANPVDKALVTKIYFGELKTWPGGGAVAAYDLAEDNAVRASFSNDILGKSVSNMKAMASQNLFSGKAVPPKQLASDDDVKKAVSANKNAIGYIKASSVDASVKAVIK